MDVPDHRVVCVAVECVGVCVCNSVCPCTGVNNLFTRTRHFKITRHVLYPEDRMPQARMQMRKLDLECPAAFAGFSIFI